MSKYTKLKSMLDKSYNSFLSYKNELDNVGTNFEKFLQEAEAEFNDSSNSNHPKKRRKQNVIEAIIEENKESESTSYSSESEDTSKRYCSGENVVPNNNTVVSNNVEEENVGVGRIKRNASKKAEAMISKQVNLTLNEKMRRPENMIEVKIKQEKLSIVPVKNDYEEEETKKKGESLVAKNLSGSRQKKTKKYYTSDSDNDLSNVIVKKENKKPAIKPRSRSPQSKILRDTSSSTKSFSDNEDDVQIQTSKRIVLTVSSDSDDDKNNKLEKMCTNESSEQTENEQSVYEDAVQNPVSASSVTSQMPSCFVRLEDINLTYNINNDSKLSSLPSSNEKTDDNLPTQILNEVTNTIMNNTVVLYKDKRSEEEFEREELPSNVKNKILLFSAHEMNESPRKSIQPVRVTRTKTRALKAAAELTESKENLYEKNYTPQDEANLKYQTPKETESLMKSNSKINNIVSNMGSFIPKPASAIKMLKSDLREKREELSTRKKLEREEEVLKKKEALIIAKVEKQKRRREEKALKAQQTREKQEKDRQMQVEIQEREKMEKLKQIQVERDAMKKEIARKRALADKRAQENEERRRAEDAIRQQRLQEQEETEKRLEVQHKRELEESDKLHQKRLQEEEIEKLHQKRLQEIEQAKVRTQKLVASKAKQLMKTKKGDGTPIAGTSGSIKAKTKTVFDLDTDSETEDEETTKRVIPTWSKYPYRQIAIEKQALIPDNIITNLFGSKPTCIDLKEVFPGISENQLRRQSSAIWKTPPRYSLMPKF